MHVFFRRDGRQALVGYDASSVALVDLASRRQVEAYSRDDGSTFGGSSVQFYGGSRFSMSADGRRLALPAGGDTIAFLDTAGDAGLPAPDGAAQVAAPADGPVAVLSVESSGEVTAQRSPGGPPVVVVPASPTADVGSQLKLSPDGRHIAFVNGQQPDTVVVADTTRPESPATRLTSGGGEVTALAFDPGGGRLLASADASTVTVWSVDGTLRARVPLKDGMRASRG